MYRHFEKDKAELLEIKCIPATIYVCICVHIYCVCMYVWMHMDEQGRKRLCQTTIFLQTKKHRCITNYFIHIKTVKKPERRYEFKF